MEEHKNIRVKANKKVRYEEDKYYLCPHCKR